MAQQRKLLDRVRDKDIDFEEQLIVVRLGDAPRLDQMATTFSFSAYSQRPPRQRPNWQVGN